MYKSSVLVSLCVHSVCCLWYLLACRAGVCHADSWASTVSLLGNEKSLSINYEKHYGNSFYWAVTTMTTVGYGDLSATNVAEMVYATGVMILGRLMFGFILGTVASTLANLDMPRVLFEDKLNTLKEEMEQQSLSPSLTRRVTKFFEYFWHRTKGNSRHDILTDLPYCMQAEVSLAITEPLLRKVSVWKDADMGFLRSLAFILKPRLFLPGEYITHRGDIGFGMFFLFSGEVGIVDEGETVLEELREGSYVGLKSLLFQVPTVNSARALTHVDTFALKREDFLSLLSDHPQTASNINKAAMKEYSLPVITT